MSNIVRTVAPTTKLAKDAQMEAERMHDVVLLLERLAAHDETTVRLIMDCLYDVGSVHYANQKLPNPMLNQLMRAMTRMSKPVFRLFAVKWFQKNCPQMIADWLYTVATFQAQPSPAVPPETIEVMQQLAASERQVRALQTRVRCLTGVAVGLFLILGGTFATSTNLIPRTFAEVIEPEPSVRPVRLRLADQPSN
ncbi:MAG: hypothetical protein HC805_01915 [Alkalinema sp. RL_2_19]|nr:hypothetical protein [Alkalinema sp. RL_2_19]